MFSHLRTYWSIFVGVAKHCSNPRTLSNTFVSAIAAMAGPQGQHSDDHRMGRWGSDDHGRGMGDGGLPSNGSMWNLEHGSARMCNCMTCSTRSFAWGVKSWSMLRGRYELNLVPMAVAHQDVTVPQSVDSMVTSSQCNDWLNGLSD